MHVLSSCMCLCVHRECIMNQCLREERFFSHSSASRWAKGMLRMSGEERCEEFGKKGVKKEIPVTGRRREREDPLIAGILWCKRKGRGSSTRRFLVFCFCFSLSYLVVCNPVNRTRKSHKATASHACVNIGIGVMVTAHSQKPETGIKWMDWTTIFLSFSLSLFAPWIANAELSINRRNRASASHWHTTGRRMHGCCDSRTVLNHK